MVVTLAVNARARMEWTYEDTLDLSTTRDDDQLNFLKQLTSGTGSGQVNRKWDDRRRLSQSSGTDLLDLAGGLTDRFGNTLTFTKIKLLFIVNKGVRSGSTYVETAGQDLLVGGAASNAWAAFVG